MMMLWYTCLRRVTIIAMLTAHMCQADPLRKKEAPKTIDNPSISKNNTNATIVNQYLLSNHSRHTTKQHEKQDADEGQRSRPIFLNNGVEHRLLSSENQLRRHANSDVKVRISPTSSKADIIICSLCPMAEEIIPCKCTCKSSTSAELTCGPDLLTCNELTDILTMASFPAPHYIRLKVASTQLQCKIEAELWGAALTFEEIHMVNNQFDVVDNNAFVPFSSTLKIINLDKNALIAVHFHAMNDLPHLTTLLLNDNMIDFIPGYSAMMLSELRDLEVSKNKLCHIQPDTFAGFPRLERLDLSHNNIKKLETHAVSISEHVGSRLMVNVSNNIISTIEENFCSGIRSLELDLRDNSLTQLPEGVLSPLIDETMGNVLIRVEGNPLDCDSSFCWIVTNPYIAKYFDNFLCSNLNKYLCDVTVDDVGGCEVNR